MINVNYKFFPSYLTYKSYRNDAFVSFIFLQFLSSISELIAFTTPWGRRGWFYNEWTEGALDWHRIRVTAFDCRRISKEFLDEEKRKMPDAWFRSEYLCSFTDTIDSVFRYEDIQAAFSGEIEPLFQSSAYSLQTTPTTGIKPLFES